MGCMLAERERERGSVLVFTAASRLYLYSIVDKTSPTEDNGLLFWLTNVLCRHSEVVLWNLLSVQMFF